MYRLSMAVSPAAVLIGGLLRSGALWLEGKGFGVVFFHPASWKVKAGQAWEVADSLDMWISR